MRNRGRWAALAAGLIGLGLVPAGLPAANAAPNDPLWEFQFGPEQVHAEAAWGNSTGAGTIVAVVDSGVDLDHEDLAGKLLPGATFLDCGRGGGSCGNGDWLSGPAERRESASPHGTHVAGIAAAVTGNGKGIAGVAPGAQILPVKVLDEEGGTSEDIANGIRWAVDHGADVVNLSLGSAILGLLPGTQVITITFEILGEPDPMNEAIAYAQAQGAVVVAAAGNESFPLCSDPAFASGALCVTATDSHEAPADYSNGAINDELLAVAAPGGGTVDYVISCGGGVLSTVPAGAGDAAISETCGYPANLAYDEYTGTSMATPHVAGAAALLLAQGCSNTEAVGLLTSTARTPVTGARGTFTPTYGYGIIDAKASTDAATTDCTGAPATGGSGSGKTTGKGKGNSRRK